MSEVGYDFDHRQTRLAHLNRESLSESKLRKARCRLKSHTVMVVKKEVCYFQVLTFGIPCRVASQLPSTPPHPQPPQFCGAENAVCHCAWLSVLIQFTNPTG